MNNQQIKKAVERFLSWKLPHDFSPDGYIDFDIGAAAKARHEPIGTNLLTAAQATAMFEHCLQDSVAEDENYKKALSLYESASKLLELMESRLKREEFINSRKSIDPTNSTDDSDHLQDSFEAKPVLYVRFRNGKIDWAEDCVSIDTACADEYIENASDKEVYEAVALYRHSTNTKEEDAKILEALKLADDCIGDIQEYNVPQWILSNIESAIEILNKRLGE